MPARRSGRITATSWELSTFENAGPLLTSVTSPQPILSEDSLENNRVPSRGAFSRSVPLRDIARQELDIPGLDGVDGTHDEKLFFSRKPLQHI